MSSNKLLRQLCGTVLIMEAVVIGLAIPVAIVQEHLRHGVAGGVGGGLAVCALLLSGLVGRPGMGWALWAGTVLQVLVIASGVVVPAMYILGAIFAALWITAIRLARRASRARPQHLATEAGVHRSGGPVARRIVGKLAVVANHQHPATGSHTTGKIIVPEPGGPASPLSE